MLTFLRLMTLKLLDHLESIKPCFQINEETMWCLEIFIKQVLDDSNYKYSTL